MCALTLSYDLCRNPRRLMNGSVSTKIFNEFSAVFLLKNLSISSKYFVLQTVKDNEKTYGIPLKIVSYKVSFLVEI